MNSFKFPRLEFVVDPAVRPLIEESIQRVKSLGVTVEEITISQSDLNLFADLLDSTQSAYTSCFQACLPSNYNKYFGNNTRFNPVDSPVKNFKQFAQSPLLNNVWKNLLTQSGLDINLLQDQQFATQVCQQACQQVNSLYPQYISFVNQKILDDSVDALFLPSITNTAPTHDTVRTLLNPPQTNTLSPISIYPGNGFLIMPSGYTPSSREDPSGLPFAMALIYKPQKLEQAFKIARLYESKSQVAQRLPHTVPYIDYSQKGIFSYFLNCLTRFFVRSI
jgi:Asp-tRNA(Asn)/Glu-tRNA(Gln) amidotransferase A subunit family amidase